MFGLIIGTVCLVALFATLRGRRHAYYGYGYDTDGTERWGCGRGVRRRAMRHHGPRNLVRGMFVRLDTTPGQEKAILAILERARERSRGLKRELQRTRKEIAALLGSEVLDRAALEARLSEPKQVLDRAGAELVEALSAIHELLDERQRRVLGELLADGSLSREPLDW